jgi:hypothetical protein
MTWYLWPLRPNVLVLQLAFTPKLFGEVVHAWPPELLARYRTSLVAGYALLAAYGAWGYLMAARSALFSPLAPWLRRSARWWLPLAAGCNAAENALHWWLTEVPRFAVPVPYAVSAGCALVKWLLLLAFGALVLYALARSDVHS